MANSAAVFSLWTQRDIGAGASIFKAAVCLPLFTYGSRFFYFDYEIDANITVDNF